MEDMLWKFPHIGKKIFNKVSCKNLVKCFKVKQEWEQFIKDEVKKFHFEMKQTEKDCIGRTPLHKAAEAGQLSVCKEIIDHVENKTPRVSINNYFNVMSVCPYVCKSVRLYSYEASITNAY